MTKFDQKAVIEGEQFDQMRFDANRILQNLLKNMVEKNTNDGTMTIKIDASFLQEYVPIPVDERTEESGESRKVLKPQFKHKISSTMQVKDDASGRSRNETMELVWDDDTGSYILTPVKGEEQMSIFDIMEEKKEDTDESGTEKEDEDEGQKQIAGRNFMPLPAPAAEEDSESPEEDDSGEGHVVDADYREVAPDDDSEGMDIPDEDDDDAGFSYGDDYDNGDYEYQIPGDDLEEELPDDDEDDELWM